MICGYVRKNETPNGGVYLLNGRMEVAVMVLVDRHTIRNLQCEQWVIVVFALKNLQDLRGEAVVEPKWRSDSIRYTQ